MNNIVKVSEGKIAIYSTPNSNVYVDVVFKDETFWMTQRAIAELFDVNTPAINKHLKNIFDDEELTPDSTISILEIVQNEGGREVTRTPEFYSLDAIIAVGYRVNSKEATNRRRVLGGKGQSGFWLLWGNCLLQNSRGCRYMADYFSKI